MNVISTTRYVKRFHSPATTRRTCPVLAARCCFHASDSGTFVRIYSASSAGSAPIQNIGRHPHRRRRDLAAPELVRQRIEEKNDDEEIERVERPAKKPCEHGVMRT